MYVAPFKSFSSTNAAWEPTNGGTLTKLNDQTDDHADDEGPLVGVERLVAYLPNVRVRRAFDAAVDEGLAGLGEEGIKVDAVHDELHADRPAQVEGVRREQLCLAPERPE